MDSNRTGNYKFLPIDFARDRELCVAIRRESYVASFGSAERFDREGDAAADWYVEWLKRGQQELPGSMVHVWVEGEGVVGQLEMTRHKKAGGGYEGRINLIYVVPDFRRKGVGSAIESYAMKFLTERGCREVCLSVGVSNTEAQIFYKARGWEVIGGVEGDSESLGCRKVVGE
jgi:ribosomal protein S18 acetylase RimI-like enzyme